MSKKTKTTKTSTTEAVSLQKVLESKGRARHERAPHRIDLKARDATKRFLIGRPSFGSGGIPEMDDDGVVILRWEPYPEEKALNEWEKNGWLLAK